MNIFCRVVSRRDSGFYTRTTCPGPSERREREGRGREGGKEELMLNLHRTRETLAAGNYLSVINILMQLRKVSLRNQHIHTEGQSIRDAASIVYTHMHTHTHTHTTTLINAHLSSCVLLLYVLYLFPKVLTIQLCNYFV